MNAPALASRPTSTGTSTAPRIKRFRLTELPNGRGLAH